MIQERYEIEVAITEHFDAVSKFIQNQPDDLFEKQVHERWTTGQELDHLVRCASPVNLALSLPKIALRLRFGKRTHTPRDYDGVVKTYQDVLANGGKAGGPYIPPTVALAKKANLLQKFNHEKQKMLKLIHKWDDTALDNRVILHPLIGKMTIREILFFTVYHTQHHLKSMNTHYGYDN